MKNLMMILALGLLLASCSTTQQQISNEEAKIYKLFTGVMLEEKELLNVLDETKRTGGAAISSRAIKLTRKYVKENSYNDQIIATAKEMENYEEFEENYLKMIDLPIARKFDLLRIKKIDQKDFQKYIESFNTIKDAAKRLDLVEKFVTNDFPQNKGGDFFARMGIMLARGPLSKRRKQVFYQEIKSNLKLATLKLNLYLFQKVPTSDLETILKVQSKKDYKEARAFIEKVQERVNRKYLKGLAKKIKG